MKYFEGDRLYSSWRDSDDFTLAPVCRSCDHFVPCFNHLSKDKSSINKVKMDKGIGRGDPGIMIVLNSPQSEIGWSGNHPLNCARIADMIVC